MGIEIRPIGGFQEIGKNMCAIKVDDEVVIFDMGIHLPNYIALTDDEDVHTISPTLLRKGNAIPDETLLGDWKDKVKAIFPSHAHLDHLAAIPWIAHTYNCPIVGTPFSMAVLRKILEDEHIVLPNKLVTIEENGVYEVSKKIRVEFIHMTHSIPQASMLALHTPYGILLYADDFKLDNTPMLGDKPNYDALKRIGKQGVKVAIVNCLYAPWEGKTPSEFIAKELLEDTLLGMDTRDKAVIVTTFSSHIARLQSIIACGKKMKRKIVFIGRSLAKYVGAAEDAGLVKFSDEVEICSHAKHVRKRLKKIKEEGPEKYLLVVTGHQGEPKAALSKIAKKRYDFLLERDDLVVFSCKTIPTEINITQRNILEEVLQESGVEMVKDIHVSGHAGAEDIKELLDLVKPEHLVPFHGTPEMSEALKQIGLGKGYKKGNIHFLELGSTWKIN
ncbi:RNase J family beta-CASP ribonuclease [Candidatus Woesearchaeota archaeon]|nr:RNase J family beta-CASP ribonuclease [Candidatus Woesearchaeota archaeon]